MSYSAYVICNCYKDGITSEPPYKEFLRFDEEGLYLDISNEIWEKDQVKAYKMEAEFDKWKRTACRHEEMELADEYLSNIAGMSEFRRIVNKLTGEDKFSVLREYLPTANGGNLPSEFAQQALDELLVLENEHTTEEKIFLTEKATDSLKASVSTDAYWLFVFTANNKNTYGIDKEGFFILENVKVNNEELSYIKFRSKNFVQQMISKDHYRFIDVASGRDFACTVKLHPYEEEVTGDYEFKAEIRHVRISSEFEYIIEPLKRLAKASILSGNPIHWV